MKKYVLITVETVDDDTEEVEMQDLIDILTESYEPEFKIKLWCIKEK